MTVRLLQPYNGQAVSTLYTGSDEAFLKATGVADDRTELASDYRPSSPAAASVLPGSQLATGTGVKADGLVGSAAARADFLDFGGLGTPINLRKWRKARANVRAGLGNARVGYIGDSTTAMSVPGPRQKAFSAYVRDILKGRGLNARYSSIFGCSDKTSATPAAYASYNPEVVMGAGWTFASLSIGGQTFLAGTSVTSSTTWTPAETIDRFDVYYARAPGLAQFNLSVDGGAATAVDANGASSMQKVTINAGSPGTHTLSIARTGGGNLNIVGAIAYDSTKPAVEVLNLGLGSSTTEDWTDASSYIRAFNVLPGLALDLGIIGLGINDRTPSYGPVPLATYETNLRALVAKVRETGDAALMVPIPSSSSRQALAIQAQYDAVVRSVAKDLACPLIDMAARWESHSVSSDLGYYFDIVHSTALGNADWAVPHANLLLA